MRFPEILKRSCILVLAMALFCAPVRAEEVVTGSDTGESINRILRKIEEMAGVLALNKTLDESQTSALIDDLSELHNEVKGLKHANELLLQLARQAVRDNVEEDAADEIPAGQAPVTPVPLPEAVPLPDAEPVPQAEPQAEAQPPASDVDPEQQAQPPATAEEPAQQVQPEPDQAEMGTTPPERTFDKWEPFLDFGLEVDPAGSQYSGWVEGSSIDIVWGDPGQMIVTVKNGYTASWTLNNAYAGSPKVNVSTRQQGEIIVQVRDDDGIHEYSLRNGGLGPVFMRWIRETSVEGNPA